MGEVTPSTCQTGVATLRLQSGQTGRERLLRPLPESYPAGTMHGVSSVGRNPRTPIGKRTEIMPLIPILFLPCIYMRR